MGFLLLPSSALAATATVAWDPVTLLVDGASLPPGQTFQYKIYIRADPSGIPVAASQLINGTQATVTFVSEGSYDLGVSTVRMEGTAVLDESDIGWSNDPAVAAGGNIFGGRYMRSGKKITNLR